MNKAFYFQKSSLSWGGPEKVSTSASVGGGGSQGLAHWMSVMAEHMTHETPLHPAYMWPNGTDVSRESIERFLAWNQLYEL